MTLTSSDRTYGRTSPSTFASGAAVQSKSGAGVVEESFNRLNRSSNDATPDANAPAGSASSPVTTKRTSDSLFTTLPLRTESDVMLVEGAWTSYTHMARATDSDASPSARARAKNTFSPGRDVTFTESRPEGRRAYVGKSPSSLTLYSNTASFLFEPRCIVTVDAFVAAAGTTAKFTSTRYRIVHVNLAGVGSGAPSPPKPRTRKLCSPSGKFWYDVGEAHVVHAPSSSMHSLWHPAHSVSPNHTRHRNRAALDGSGGSMRCPGMRPSSVTGDVRPLGRGVARIRVSGAPLNTTPPRSAPPPSSSPAVRLPPLSASSTASAVSVSAALVGVTERDTASRPGVASEGP